MNPIRFNGSVSGLDTLYQSQGLSSYGRKPVFKPFVQYVGPKPTPRARDFYWDNFISNVWPSWKRGGQRYKQELDAKPWKRIFHYATAVGFGFALTAFYNNQTVVKGLALAAFPIVKTVREFMNMADAYEEVQKGNPRKGQAMFREAMDEVSYGVQHYLSPLLWGGSIAFILALPRFLKPEANGLFSRVMRFGMEKFRISVHLPPFSWLDKLNNQMDKVGDAILAMPKKMWDNFWAGLKR